MLKIGVIGTGYWGKHHLRIFSKLPCKVVGIADIDPQKEKLADEFQVSFFTDYKKLLKKVDAVSIVTPPVTHYKLARKALKAGKHVLLEKPFVFKPKEAQELKGLAESSRLTFMAGHTYLYHPGIIKLKNLIKQGELGTIYYLLLQWFNLGIIRRDINALWNFAPHPFSILYFLFNELPREISVHGNAFIQKNIEDVVFANLRYESGIVAQVNLSWLHPVKRREVTVVGSKKLIFFDDVSADAPLKIYDKGISPEEFDSFLNWNSYAEFQSKSRYGNIEVPKLEEVEPLEAEFRDFIDSIAQKRQPAAGIDSALATVTLMDKAQKSLIKGGISIEISP